jgi:multiple sugar transport system substrate-binding protein
MIGGTALGVSSLSGVADAAIAFVGFMLEPEVQDQLIPGHHGQAARLSSWLNKANDLRFNGFFSATLPSIQSAWIRPRSPGYPVFQREAGYIVAEALKAGADGEDAVDAVLPLADQVRADLGR